MRKLEPESVRQEIFIQLAFSLYGCLIAPTSNENEPLTAEYMGFATDADGTFYLINKKTPLLEALVYDQNAIFTVLKEGNSVSEMYEIQIQGKLLQIEPNQVDITLLKDLFDEKSPYFANIPFANDVFDESFIVTKINPQSIKFQNLQDMREGYQPIYLKK